MKNYWEHFSHGADVGVRGCGDSLEVAFEMAALALMAVVSDSTQIKEMEKLEIRCSAPNLEVLFYDWMNALIYEMDTRKILFKTFTIQIQNQNHSLIAQVTGEKLSARDHKLKVEPKGATFTELKVLHTNNKWQVGCVIDV